MGFSIGLSIPEIPEIPQIPVMSGDPIMTLIVLTEESDELDEFEEDELADEFEDELAEQLVADEL